MKICNLTGAVLAFMLAPYGALAWTAGNSQTVNPLSAQSFEVLGQAGSANVDYWCAAGDYARRVLGTATAQRIYVLRGRAHAQTANRKSAVQFSLEPPDGANLKAGWLLSVTRVGENLSMLAAWNYCMKIKGD